MSDGFDFSIRLENNTPVAQEELKQRTETALYVMGINGVEGAVTSISGEYLAVDTGRLRASISFITPQEAGDSGLAQPPNAEGGDRLSGAAEANSVVIGSNVEYAEKVHNGDSRMAARPFLRAGIDNVREKMKEEVERVFHGDE